MTKETKKAVNEPKEKKPKVEKDYTVELFTGQQEKSLVFNTKVRKLARAMVDLAAENGMTCNVTVLAKPKPVKFRGR